MTETDVEHIVNFIQEYNSPLPKGATSFLYINESTRLSIRLGENESHYAVFINEVFG